MLFIRFNVSFSSLAEDLSDPRRSGYTLFAPRDDAFWRVLVQDATAPDPFLGDADFRLRTLLGHLVEGRIFPGDLRTGQVLATAGGGNLMVVEASGTGGLVYY